MAALLTAARHSLLFRVLSLSTDGVREDVDDDVHATCSCLRIVVLRAFKTLCALVCRLGLGRAGARPRGEYCLLTIEAIQYSNFSISIQLGVSQSRATLTLT